MQSDILSKSLTEAFEQITSTVIDRVHLMWKSVLQLFVSGKYTIKVIKEYCGLKKKVM